MLSLVGFTVYLPSEQYDNFCFHPQDLPWGSTITRGHLLLSSENLPQRLLLNTGNVLIPLSPKLPQLHYI